MKKLIIILLLSLAIGCTTQKTAQLPEDHLEEIKISSEVDKQPKSNRSDEDVADAIKADNEKFDAIMNEQDENSGSLGGLIEFGIFLLQLSRF